MSADRSAASPSPRSIPQIEQAYAELLDEQGSRYATQHRQCAKDVLALVAENGRYREALEAIESMAGAGGAGQIPALPVAARAREALA